jgi:L-ascorbate metabolism protein UlaG (beta-lactamase superfamily)
MKSACIFFLLTAQALCAGLEKYSQFVVADSERNSGRGVGVTYLGTNGFEFRSGTHALLVDPYFSRISLSRIAFGLSIQPDSPRIDDGLKNLSPNIDAVLVTHGHFDHLLDVPVIMKKDKARLIASSVAVELAERAGAPAARCDVVTAGDVRRIGPWKIRALPARHDRLFGKIPFDRHQTHDSGPPKRAGDWICGEPLAFLIEIDGQRIYIDSGGTPAQLPPNEHVDLAILGVALPDSRARFSAAVQGLHTRYVFPSHQDNFFRPLSAGFTFGPLTDFRRVLRDYGNAQLPGRLILLDYFRPWTVPEK